MTPAETAMYRTAVVSTVRMPYLVIAGVFSRICCCDFLSHLPEVGATDGAVEQVVNGEELAHIWRYGHLVKGVIAQFFYVGAQTAWAASSFDWRSIVFPECSKRMLRSYLKCI